MKTYKITVFIATFLLTVCNYTSAVAQTEKDVKVELLKLRDYSIKYDTYVQSMPTKYPAEMKVAEKNYKDQITKIKKGPNKDLYIKFLDIATGADSLKYKSVAGMYYTAQYPAQLNVMRSLPSLLEYYKVVKYSLFTMNREDLVRPENLPFLKYKEKLRIKPGTFK